jgi:hypothetical protein
MIAAWSGNTEAARSKKEGRERLKIRRIAVKIGLVRRLGHFVPLVVGLACRTRQGAINRTSTGVGGCDECKAFWLGVSPKSAPYWP